MMYALRRLMLCLAFTVPAGLALAQSATISGTITDEDGEPLIGANVLIEELVIGGSTDLDGRYSFDVPANQVRNQVVTLRAGYVGYSPMTREITLSPGEQEQNFELNADLLNLDEVVVTGVTEATPQKKLAFTVSKLDAEAIELAPPASAVESMQGKVAGAQVISNSGQPGEGLSVRLRGSTSITGSSEPLYIVDGVILGANQVDLDALDIESMEVVKGAAASSLYGSRAQNGVVQITTKRGSNVPLNQTRITVRNEFGVNQLPKTLQANSAHNLRVNAQGQFVDADGNVNACDTCLPNGYGPGTLVADDINGESFYDNPYTGTTYNSFEQFFDPGNTYSNYIAISQNSSKTNFHASFSNYDEAGVVTGMNGYNRKNFRLNLDHRVYSNLSVSASATYSQSERDAPQSAAFNPFFGLMFTNPLTNLAARDEGGELLVQADPLAVEENPLYQIENAVVQQNRSRLLGNARARYSPTNWMDVDANFSYDRSDRDGFEFYDRGFESIDPSSFNDGQIQRSNAYSEAINADVTASFRRSFNRMTARSQLKYQIENFNSYSEFIQGSELTSKGIRDLSNVSGEKNVSSSNTIVRSEGYYATFGLDYADRYIADFLVRRDGSSLFGADERWHNYFRGSLAYRVSEEAWWPFDDAVEEFKLRYSYGTAGGRPSFQAQYETFFLSNGNLSKGTLGNADLKPELQTEQEFGLDMAFLDRFFLEFVYADSRVEDQLLRVPLAGYFGFGSQWRNAGTLESNTIEAALNANILRKRDLSLDMGLIFDRTRQEITEFDANRFTGGPQNAFQFGSGETLGAMYGFLWITEADQLPEGMNPAAFDTNDDGYLVPVGEGNTFTDGISKELWGTTVDADGDGAGDYAWGQPVRFFDETEETEFVRIGDVLPDFNLGWSSTFRFKGLTAYMLWNAQVGGDVYNFTRQYSYRDGRASDQDQTGKSDGMKKPASYYERLYDATAINSHFIEDGTYVKLRELSLGYTFDRAQLRGVFGDVLNRMTVSVIGRNLLTFSDYQGFDPEVGSTAGGGGVGGDASLYRVDNFSYPIYRTFTGKLEIQF